MQRGRHVRAAIVWAAPVDSYRQTGISLCVSPHTIYIFLLYYYLPWSGVCVYQYFVCARQEFIHSLE